MKKLSVYQILTLFLFIQILIVKILSYFPDTIERFYSNGIYPVISKIFRTFLGWIPFSIGDIFYFMLAILLIIGVYQLLRDKFKNWKFHLFKFGAYLSVFYFLFHLLWGLNYYRNTLFTTLEMKPENYTLEDIEQLTENLLVKLKEVHLNIVEHDTLKVVVPYSKDTILSKTINGYTNLAKIYPEYYYQKVSLKKSLYSLPLTYMGFSGYLNPISGEAHVDHLVPKVNLPMISSHEVAHQIGIAKESEANFIGFLAAINNDDNYFKYSGYLTAFRYSAAALYYKDSMVSRKVIDSLPLGILKNIKESQEFWQSYQNQLEPFFKLFYDGYLKANDQKAGLKSYSNMVYYLVAYDKKNGV